MPDVFVNQPQTRVEPVHSVPLMSEPLGFFSSYSKNPEHVSFKAQEPNETILLFLRAHFIKNISWIFFTLFLLVVPLLLQLFFSLFQFPLLLSSQLLTILTLLYYGLVFSYAYIQFLTWFYNIGLITTKRIVDIDFSDLIFHDVAITKLEFIEDVHYRKTGFFSSLLDYGDLFIQTASDKQNFEFLKIPKPSQATDLIIHLIGKKESHE